jgi:hypothetical protein
MLYYLVLVVLTVALAVSVASGIRFMRSAPGDDSAAAERPASAMQLARTSSIQTL